MNEKGVERYLCPLCGSAVPTIIRPTHAAAEAWLIERIKHDHPEWLQADGACPRCIDEYRAMLRSA